MVEEEKLLHWLGLGERRRHHTDKQIRNGKDRIRNKQRTMKCSAYQHFGKSFPHSNDPKTWAMDTAFDNIS